MVIRWFKKKSVEPPPAEAPPKPPPIAPVLPTAPKEADLELETSLFAEDAAIAGPGDDFDETFDDVVAATEKTEATTFEAVQAELEAEVAAADQRRAAADAAQRAFDAAELEAEGLFERLREGLSRTQEVLVGQLRSVLNLKDRIDDELLDDIEDILIHADVGAKSADMIRERLAKLGREQEVYDPDALAELVRGTIVEILEQGQRPMRHAGKAPTIYLVVGVNGTGKTTSIGKIALEFAHAGKSVMLVAADTFRAAAVEQLTIWGERTGACLVSSEKEGADPASVCFEGLTEAARSTARRRADRHCRAPPHEEVSDGRTRQGHPCDQEGLSRRTARNVARDRRHDGAECAQSGKHVPRGG
jgi:fused signal recognition particle receptor